MLLDCRIQLRKCLFVGSIKDVYEGLMFVCHVKREQWLDSRSIMLE